jgi:hypothetical protein
MTYLVDIKYWWFPFRWFSLNDGCEPWAKGFLSEEGAKSFIDAHKKDFIISPREPVG